MLCTGHPHRQHVAVPGQVHRNVIIWLPLRCHGKVAQRILNLQPGWVKPHQWHMLVPQLAEQVNYPPQVLSELIPIP